MYDYIYIMFKAALNYRVGNQDNVCLPLMKRGKWDCEGAWGCCSRRNVLYFEPGGVYLVLTFVWFIPYALFYKYTVLWVKK